MDEGDRWFHIQQDRKRDRQRLADRARRRAKRAAEREEQMQRAFATNAATAANIQMQYTEWTYDEFGNLSRKIYST